MPALTPYKFGPFPNLGAAGDLQAQVQMLASRMKYLEGMLEQQRRADFFAFTAQGPENQRRTSAITLEYEQFTNNDPAAGSVSWNRHWLWWGGKQYEIPAGSTADKYVYWVNGATSYSTSATFPSLAVGDFLIAVNNGGTVDFAWNKVGVESVGSAQIASLSADKVIVNDLTALSSGDGYTKMKGSGVEVWDSGTPSRKRLHLGQYAAGLFGLRVIGQVDGSGNPTDYSDYGAEGWVRYVGATALPYISVVNVTNITGGGAGWSGSGPYYYTIQLRGNQYVGKASHAKVAVILSESLQFQSGGSGYSVGDVDSYKCALVSVTDVASGVDIRVESWKYYIVSSSGGYPTYGYGQLAFTYFLVIQ